MNFFECLFASIDTHSPKILIKYQKDDLSIIELGEYSTIILTTVFDYFKVATKWICVNNEILFNGVDASIECFDIWIMFMNALCKTKLLLFLQKLPVDNFIKLLKLLDYFCMCQHTLHLLDTFLNSKYTDHHFVIKFFEYYFANKGPLSKILYNRIINIKHKDIQISQSMQYIGYSDLKKGKVVIMKEKFPCKIIQIKTSKTGKHGHAKRVVTGTDIVTNKKYQELFKHSSLIKVPDVLRETWAVIGVSEDCYLTLMDSDGSIREDIKVSSEDASTINKYLEFTTVSIKLMIVEFDDTLLYKIEQIIED